MSTRKFAIIGHRAISSGKLPLNDISGIGGRMDVLLRAVNSALFLSHGIREDTSVILHLMGGSGPPRRILFEGENLRGLHSDERAIAGRVAKILLEPVPPIGVFSELGNGISHSGGNIKNTISEWKKEELDIIKLDADGIPLSKYMESVDGGCKLGFILSDDKDFTSEEKEILDGLKLCSIGSKWLQGHSVISIVHHVIDGSFLSS